METRGEKKFEAKTIPLVTAPPVVDVAASAILIWLLHLSLYVFAVAFAAFAFCLHM